MLALCAIFSPNPSWFCQLFELWASVCSSLKMGIINSYSTRLTRNSQWDILWEKVCNLESDTDFCYREEPDTFGQPANLSLGLLVFYGIASQWTQTSSGGLKQRHKQEKGIPMGYSVNGLACEWNVSTGRISAKRKVFPWCCQSRVTKCRLALPGACFDQPRPQMFVLQWSVLTICSRGSTLLS